VKSRTATSYLSKIENIALVQDKRTASGGFAIHGETFDLINLILAMTHMIIEKTGLPEGSRY
jgi:hypothetical protein